MGVFSMVHKLLTRFCLIERTTEGTCRGDGILLLHTTHLHTHVLGLNNDHHPHRLQRILNALHHLLGHASHGQSCSGR